MMREILLVGETPEVHSQLVRILGASGVQVIPEATLRAAISLLRDPAHVALAVVLEMPLFSRSDFDLLADLSVRHPQVKKIVFAPGGFSEVLLDRLHSCSHISYFQHVITRSNRGAIDPGCDYARDKKDGHISAASGAMATKNRPEETYASRSRPPESTPSRTDASESLYDEEFLRRVGRSDVPVCCMAKQARAKKSWRENYGPTPTGWASRSLS